ncbi:MAG: hypothetical protein ACOYMG_17935, partial [Candidatus Methylumidiphilus sp.]
MQEFTGAVAEAAGQGIAVELLQGLASEKCDEEGRTYCLVEAIERIAKLPHDHCARWAFARRLASDL